MGLFSPLKRLFGGKEEEEQQKAVPYSTTTAAPVKTVETNPYERNYAQEAAREMLSSGEKLTPATMQKYIQKYNTIKQEEVEDFEFKNYLKTNKIGENELELMNARQRAIYAGIDTQEVEGGKKSLLDNVVGGVFKGLEILDKPRNILAGITEASTDKFGKKLSQAEYDVMSPEQREAYYNDVYNVEDTLGNRLKHIAKSAGQGLTHEKEFAFGQTIRNMTQGGKREDGKFDASDVVGMGLDMFADPVDLLTAGVFKSFDGLKAANKAQDALKGIDEVAEVAAEAAKRTEDIASGFAEASVKSGGVDSLVNQLKGSNKLSDAMKANHLTPTYASQPKWQSLVQESGELNTQIRTLTERLQSGGKRVASVAEDGSKKFLKLEDEIERLTKLRDQKIFDAKTIEYNRKIGAELPNNGVAPLTPNYNKVTYKANPVVSKAKSEATKASKVLDKLVADGANPAMIKTAQEKAEAAQKALKEAQDLDLREKILGIAEVKESALKYIAEREILPLRPEEIMRKRLAKPNLDGVGEVGDLYTKFAETFDENVANIISDVMLTSGNADEAIQAGLETWRKVNATEAKKFSHDVLNKASEVVKKGSEFDSQVKELASKLHNATSIQEISDVTKSAQDLIANVRNTQERIANIYKVPKKELSAVEKAMAYTDANGKIFGTLLGGAAEGVKKVAGLGVEAKAFAEGTRARKFAEATGKTASEAYEEQMKAMNAVRNSSGSFADRAKQSLNHFKKSVTQNLDLKSMVKGSTMTQSEHLRTGLHKLYQESDELKHVFENVDEFTSVVGDVAEYVNRTGDTFKLSDYFEDLIDGSAHKLFGFTEDNLAQFEEVNEGLRKHFKDNFFIVSENAETGGKFFEVNPKIIPNKKGEALPQEIAMTLRDALDGSIKDPSGKRINLDGQRALGKEYRMELKPAYTPEQTQFLEEMASNPLIRDAAEKYTDMLSNTKRTASHIIAGDANKIDDFYGGNQKAYVPHAQSNPAKEFFAKLRMSAEDASDSNFAKTVKAQINETMEQAGKVTSQPKVFMDKKRRVHGSRLESNAIMAEEWFREIAGEDNLMKHFGGNVEKQKEAYDALVTSEFFTSQLESQLDKFDSTLGNIAEAKKVTDMAVSSMFGEPSQLTKADASATTRIVKGDVAHVSKDFRKLDENDLNYIKDVLAQRQKLIGKGESRQLDEMLHQVSRTLNNKGQHMIMHNDVYRNVFVTASTPMEDIWKGFDALTNVFKKGKVMSISTHINNIFGNMGNQLMAGMRPDQIAKYNAQSRKLLDGYEKAVKAVMENGIDHVAPEIAGQFTEYTNLIRAGVVSGSDFAVVQDLFQFTPNGIESYFAKKYIDAGKAQEGSLAKLMGGFNKIAEKNMEFNEAVDSTMRFGSYLFAKENPEIMAKFGGMSNPLEFARLVNYDPTDLTLLESQTVKRLIPFYTFTRQNYLFQYKNMMANPTNVRRIMRMTDSAWKGVGIDRDEDLKDYERQNMNLPNIFKMNNRSQEEIASGQYDTIKNPNPVNAIMDFLDPADKTAGAIGNDIVHKAVGMSSPFLKAPFEQVTGIDTFTGAPIEKYPGQIDPRYGMSKKTMNLFGHTGVDVPIKQAYNAMSAVSNVLQGNDEEAKVSLEKLINIFTTGDAQQNHEYKAKDLSKLYDGAFQKYKDEHGTKAPTMSELRKLGQWNEIEDILKQQMYQTRK